MSPGVLQNIQRCDSYHRPTDTLDTNLETGLEVYHTQSSASQSPETPNCSNDGTQLHHLSRTLNVLFGDFLFNVLTTNSSQTITDRLAPTETQQPADSPSLACLVWHVISFAGMNHINQSVRPAAAQPEPAVDWAMEPSRQTKLRDTNMFFSPNSTK